MNSRPRLFILCFFLFLLFRNLCIFFLDSFFFFSPENSSIALMILQLAKGFFFHHPFRFFCISSASLVRGAYRARETKKTLEYSFSKRLGERSFFLSFFFLWLRELLQQSKRFTVYGDLANYFPSTRKRREKERKTRRKKTTKCYSTKRSSLLESIFPIGIAQVLEYKPKKKERQK